MKTLGGECWVSAGLPIPRLPTLLISCPGTLVLPTYTLWKTSWPQFLPGPMILCYRNALQRVLSVAISNLQQPGEKDAHAGKDSTCVASICGTMTCAYDYPYL